jgi:hypothetical protein
MATPEPRAALALALGLLLLPSCTEVRVERLFALPLAERPRDGAWPASLPLPMKAGGGNVGGPNRRLAELQLDTDAVHAGSASCHHGPPITSPVHLEARAFYTGRDLQVEIAWEDPTEDRRPRAWERGGAGWRLGGGDQDGVAIIWTRAAGAFGCQEACHMSDFSLRQGELVDLRAMVVPEGQEREETWVWKPAQGAQALLLGPRGFETIDGGERYRTLNSTVANDAALRPEASRAGTFGPDDRPLAGADRGPLPPGADTAPADFYAGGDGEGGLTAVASRTGRGWRVVFRRRLDLGAGRQRFEPGARYRFGVAVFDATTTDHHIVRDAQTLELVAPPAAPPAGEREGPLAGGGLRGGARMAYDLLSGHAPG